MHIVFCTTVLPSKKRTGGEIASQSFIDAIRDAGHSVSVFGYLRPDDNNSLAPGEVCVGRRPIETDGAGTNKYMWVAGAVRSGLPYSAHKYVSNSYLRALENELSKSPRALVVIDHAQTGFLLDAVPSECAVVFIAHNVEEHIYRAQLGTASSRLKRWLMAREARLIADLERRVSRRSECTWVLTEADRVHFAGSGGKRVSVAEIPATRFGCGIAPSSCAYDIGLIGTWTWRANAEGLAWFQREVVPLLSHGLRIAVAGKGAENIVRAPVQALGFVPDAMEFLESCAVIAIPSTSGGGIQVKTLDAIATGRPIVATSMALRGIDEVPNSVRSADTAESFVQALESTRLAHVDHGKTALAWSRARAERFREVINAEISVISRKLD